MPEFNIIWYSLKLRTGSSKGNGGFIIVFLIILLLSE